MKPTLVIFAVWAAFALGVGQEVRLGPAPSDVVADWAQAFVPLRLRATPSQPVEFDTGGLLLAQWGEIGLGTARYAFLLGVAKNGEVGMWVDSNRDRRLMEGALAGVRGPGKVEWRVELLATPAGGEPYPYPLTVLWPEGRGYVYLLGGAARTGELVVDGVGATFVLVDGDLDGVFGTKGDFYAVDVDRDGVVHGDPDGHERFALGEPFTVGEKSFRLSQISPSGSLVKLASAPYAAPKPPLVPGFPAPEIRFTSLLDGRSRALSDLRGKVVLVDFWATWCEPCKAEVPFLLELYKEHHAAGFEIVGLSLDTSERDLREFLSAKGIRWPIAFEGKSWDNSVAQLYRVYQIPTSYLLDRKGIIRYRDLHGAELAEKVVELLSASLAPAPVAPGPVAIPVVSAPRPILEIRVPAEVGLVPGEGGSFAVRLVNMSPYDAEEVKVSALSLSVGTASPEVEAGTIPAFGEREVRLSVEGAAGGPSRSGVVEVLYHYCIGDSCFQIQDRAEVAFAWGEAPRATSLIPTWWLLVFIGVGLVVAVFLRGRALAAVGLALVGLSVASLVVGYLRGQATQAWRIGSVLCTSCVGIEEVRAEVPTLSPADRAALVAFAGSARLVVFSTPWCKSCPYAKALVGEVARANPRITYELVDADQDRTRAEEAGVVQSGRVIVPAILIAETKRVLFGTADLTARILAALGEIR